MIRLLSKIKNIKVLFIHFQLMLIVNIGYWGEVDNSLIKHYKIKNKLYFADFSYEKLNSLQMTKYIF